MNLTTKREPRLIVGGESRVSLLPPIIAAQSQERRAKRMLITGVVAIVVVVGAGFGYATFAAAGSALMLADAQSRTVSLIQQQGEFIEVQQVQSEIDAVTAAQQVGTLTEVDWKSFIDTVSAELPAGAVISALVTDQATPLEGFPVSTNPLDGPRLGSVVFTANSPTLPDVPAWVEGLLTIESITDVTPGSITRVEDDGSYDMTVTIHFDGTALEGRFSEAPADDEAADDDAADDDDADSTSTDTSTEEQNR